jgi:hypothetical protein
LLRIAENLLQIFPVDAGIFISLAFFPGAYQMTAAAEVMAQFLLAYDISRSFI